MKRPGMRWSATPTLNAGASCGASSDDGTADDDVVGVSAHAASTPAITNVDASRLTDVRDIDEFLPGYVLHILPVERTEKRSTPHWTCIAPRARAGCEDVVENCRATWRMRCAQARGVAVVSGACARECIESRALQHTNVYVRRQERGETPHS